MTFIFSDNINTDIFGANLYDECLTTCKSNVPAELSISKSGTQIANCFSVLVKVSFDQLVLSEVVSSGGSVLGTIGFQLRYQKEETMLKSLLVLLLR